jgi:hypothetical protein
MKKERKPFNETGFGQFLSKAGSAIKENGGDVAGIAIKAATGNISGAIADVADMLGKAPSDPETHKLLYQLELNRLEWEKEIELAYLEDVQDARQMQVEALKQDSWLAKHFIYLLSGFIILAATFFGVMLFFIEFPEENRRMVEMFSDIYLFGGAIMVLNFHLGSSKGSADKNGMIDKLKTNLTK